MSDAASNVALLKDGYRRWHESKGGSVDHWMTLVADDISFGSLAQAAPQMAFARTYSNSINSTVKVTGGGGAKLRHELARRLTADWSAGPSGLSTTTPAGSRS